MITVRNLKTLALTLLLGATIGAAGTLLSAQSPANPAPAPGIMDREQAAHIFPATVFYRGQTASIQGRNSSGVRFADGRLMLAAIVDTSGYSTSVQETYQAYLITELPLSFGGKVLKPGAYGFGFIAGDQMVVMDISGSELLRATTTRDAKMARPNPLQILKDGANYRLYLGRSYITFSASPGPLRHP